MPILVRISAFLINPFFLQAHNKLYFYGIDEDASANKVSTLHADPILQKNVGGTTMGFGLALMNGKWNAQKLADTTKKYAYNLLAVTDLSGRVLTKTAALAADDTPTTTCNSGGPGANSCSFGEGFPISRDCTITCNCGYYACCNSSQVMCFCVISPAP
jgi:hypothetical protein